MQIYFLDRVVNKDVGFWLENILLVFAPVTRYSAAFDWVELSPRSQSPLSRIT